MTRLDYLQAIRDIASQMSALATAYDWAGLEALEAKEREMALAIPSLYPVSGLSAQERALVSEILAIHSTIEDITIPLWQDMKILLEAFTPDAE